MINRLHKIAVIGAGSWGTALSMVLATRECEVVLWTPVEAQARELAETRRNPVLSETAAPLAPNIHPTCDLNLVKDAELIVVVVPSVAMRSVAQQLRDLPVRSDAVIVSCTKGIEQGTHKRMTEILQEYLPCLLRHVSGLHHILNLPAPIARHALQQRYKNFIDLFHKIVGRKKGNIVSFPAPCHLNQIFGIPPVHCLSTACILGTDIRANQQKALSCVKWRLCIDGVIFL